MTVDTALVGRLEAVLFVADQPLSLMALATGLGEPLNAVREGVAALMKEYSAGDGAGSGVDDGAGDGSASGVVADGVLLGAGDSATDGAADGVRPGARAAAGDGVADGATDSAVVDGVPDGVANGARDGSIDGVGDGADVYAGYDSSAGNGRARGFELREVGGGYRFYVREQFDAAVSDFVNSEGPSKLSQAALETLAVIAYKQPVTRGQVASIRAVNVDSVVRTLLGRGLIAEVFTDPETGAINYGTTELLLAQLGINSIDELPKISPLLDDGSEGFDDGAA